MDRAAWLHIDPGSHFSIQNLPYGIFSNGNGQKKVAVAVGDHIIDLAAAHSLGLFKGVECPSATFEAPFLNAFITLGKPVWKHVREALQRFLADEDHPLRGDADRLLIPMRRVVLHLPVRIGNYTDFYASEVHATTVGRLFRPEQPLFPNWKSLPVAYHGRASSVVVSGTEVRRPYGQVMLPGEEGAILTPTRALDFEVELGCIIGKPSRLGYPVPVHEADTHVFGFVLLNDWSARDIQRWEYKPLGPFTSKNFMTTISPWVVTAEALQPFTGALPEQVPAPLPYLRHPGAFLPDITLTAAIAPDRSETTLVTTTGSKYLYWTFAQQIAHHTITGCNLEVGDLLGTGTLSGPSPGTAGCLLELTAGGSKPVTLRPGISRTYLEDGDEVILSGFCRRGGLSLGFGEARGQIVPSSL